MPGLSFGRDSVGEAKRFVSRVDDLLVGDDVYRGGAADCTEQVPRGCGSVECSGGWARPWRSKKRPVFEGQWGCSGRCVLAMVRAAIRREMGDRRAVSATVGMHRHRVPLGLVMLAQGWITHPQLKAALQAQRQSGSGRIGDWLVSECGLGVEQVTRGLSVQWSCPVLTTEGFSAQEMALVMPSQFVEEFGMVPLRVAGGRLLYLGCEDRLNASVAYVVEQMSGLKVESGLVDGSQIEAAKTRLLDAEAVMVTMGSVEDEDSLAARITAVLEHRQPMAARLVRLHQYYWLRLWLESGTRGVAGSLPRSMEDMQDCLFTVGSNRYTS
jgi:hypothetical protein